MTIENRDNLGMIDGQTVFGVRLQSLAKASLGNGVLAQTVTTTALKTTQREAGANMSVDVQLGKCLINGLLYDEAADVNVVISAAHATSERIDLIVYDQSAGNPAVVAGTAHATSPQVPDVTDDLDIPLALVYVLPQDDGAYTGTITTEYIYDIRSFVKTYHTTTVASDNLAMSDDATRGVVNASAYTKLKEILVGSVITGSRVKFDLRQYNGAQSAKGRVYKNGVALGTEKTEAGSVFVTQSEDIACALVPGDLLQLYAYASAITSVEVRNFRLYHDTIQGALYTLQDP